MKWDKPTETSARRRWPRLTDADVTSINGDRGALISWVSASHARTSAEAQTDVDAWAATTPSPVPPKTAPASKSSVPSFGSTREQPAKAVGANLQHHKITEPDEIHPPEPDVPTVPRYETEQEQREGTARESGRPAPAPRVAVKPAK